MSNTSAKQVASIDGLCVSFKNSVCTIKLNRPKKLNALTLDMYNGIRDVLNCTANDDTVKLVYITGTGIYFSSGNDISNFILIPSKEQIKKYENFFQEFVKAFIVYPKIILVGVNGPAVGIAVTILPLADFVYASDSATFQTPFTKFGLTPEGCSTFTFPRIMGYARANEVLIAGRKLTAQDAFDRGLLTDIIHQREFHRKIDEKVQYISSLPFQSITYSKALMRNHEQEILLNVNEEECARVKERGKSEEVRNAAMTFFAKNSKM